MLILIKPLRFFKRSFYNKRRDKLKFVINVINEYYQSQANRDGFGFATILRSKRGHLLEIIFFINAFNRKSINSRSIHRTDLKS